MKKKPPFARAILSHTPLTIRDLEMMDELNAFMASIDGRSDLSTISLAGRYRAVSAAVDVSIHTPDKIRQMLDKSHGVIRKLATTRKVTVAAVRSHCVGGGAELAFFFSSRRRHTRWNCDWSSDVYSSDLSRHPTRKGRRLHRHPQVRRRRHGGRHGR